MRIGGSFNSARAIERRWRSPPDSARPRSPTLPASPSGWRAISSVACARSAASRNCSSVAFGLPTRRFSAIERLNSSAS
jgi:hypothetical protein